MNPTAEQQEVIFSDERIVLVNAMAGTGKTSTLIKFCEEKKRVSNATFAYFTFNASMAKEAKESFAKLGNNMIYVGTIHSYAINNITNADYYKERIKDKRKLRNIHILEILGINDERISFFLLKAMRAFLISDKDFLQFELEKTLSDEEIEHLESFYGSELQLRNVIKEIWDEIDRNKTLPYEHDFYLKKFQLENQDIQADYILVDESQDLNPVMLSILRGQQAKMVFVGDTYQQIYNFRGCVNALHELKNESGAKTFFLTTTFRCPQEIVKKAIPYLSLLGVPQERMLNGFEKNELIDDSSKPVVICRTNAGILDYLMKNQKQRVSFIGGVASYDFKKINEIGLCISQNEEVKKFIKDDLLRSLRNKEALMEYLKENDDVELKSRINIFFKFLKEDINPYTFIQNIKDFGAGADVFLTTAHRSKGLEWDRVEIYDDFPKVKTLSEIGFVELNLLYVAITRAKKEVVLPEDYHISEDELKTIKKNLKITQE